MATLQIKITNKQQLKHIFKAEEELTKAGVIFDTGGFLVDEKAGMAIRDWELDSIEGATLTPAPYEILLTLNEQQAEKSLLLRERLEAIGD